jgi:hypothetical protein
MAIRFRCCNPSCRKTLQAPETSAGRRVRCGACHAEQRVPAGDALSIHVAPPQRPAQSSEAQSGPKALFESGNSVRCEECGRQYPVTECLCPECGRVNAKRFQCAPPVAQANEAQARRRPLLVEWLLAPLFGFTNLRSLLIMSGVMLLDLAPLSALPVHAMAIRTGLNSPMGGRLPGGFFMMVSVGGFLVQIVAWGYLLQFYLEVIRMAQLDIRRAPDAPDFAFVSLWTWGVRGLGMFVLYVAPVVTLPLLPLGLLALCEGDDDQALDPRWIIRAALRHPLALLELWLVSAAWLIAGALVVGFLCPVAFLGAMGPWVGWAAAIVLAVLVHLFWFAVWRSLGLVARRHQLLLARMPERGNPAAMLMCLGIALAISQLVWVIGLPRIFESSAS